jgi:hypothetical protein
MHLLRDLLRRFSCHDAYRAAALQVDKRCRDFSPVAELQRALAEAAAGYDRDGIGGAAVDLDVGDEALAVFAGGIVDAEPV